MLQLSTRQFLLHQKKKKEKKIYIKARELLMHHLLVATRVVPGDDIRAPLPVRSGSHAQLGGSRPDHLGCFLLSIHTFPGDKDQVS